jgi:hypothetical protein
MLADEPARDAELAQRLTLAPKGFSRAGVLFNTIDFTTTLEVLR